ncbi:hypothetical protein LXL04_004061 [Taraxacum kok-saghyz]
MVVQIVVMMCEIVGTVFEIEGTVFEIEGAVFDTVVVVTDTVVLDTAVCDTAVLDTDTDTVVVFASMFETPAVNAEGLKMQRDFEIVKNEECRMSEECRKTAKVEFTTGVALPLEFVAASAHTGGDASAMKAVGRLLMGVVALRKSSNIHRRGREHDMPMFSRLLSLYKEKGAYRSRSIPVKRFQARVCEELNFTPYSRVEVSINNLKS